MYYCKECRKVHNTFIDHVKNLIEKYEKIKINNPYKDIIVYKTPKKNNKKKKNNKRIFKLKNYEIRT